MEQKRCMSEEKEFFLRGKMADLYFFAIKSTVTISSVFIFIFKEFLLH